MFETQVNKEIIGGGTIDFGGRTFGSYDKMRDYRVSSVGQCRDPQTGIEGGTGAIALAKAKAQGICGSDLDAFIDRIGGRKG